MARKHDTKKQLAAYARGKPPSAVVVRAKAKDEAETAYNYFTARGFTFEFPGYLLIDANGYDFTVGEVSGAGITTTTPATVRFDVQIIARAGEREGDLVHAEVCQGAQAVMVLLGRVRATQPMVQSSRWPGYGVGLAGGRVDRFAGPKKDDRDLVEVLDAMLLEMGGAPFPDLRTELEKIRASAGFAAPEIMGGWWQAAGAAVNNCLRDNHWTRATAPEWLRRAGLVLEGKIQKDRIERAEAKVEAAALEVDEQQRRTAAQKKLAAPQVYRLAVKRPVWATVEVRATTLEQARELAKEQAKRLAPTEWHDGADRAEIEVCPDPLEDEPPATNRHLTAHCRHGHEGFCDYCLIAYGDHQGHSVHTKGSHKLEAEIYICAACKQEKE